MKILLLCHAFNCLSQRLFVELSQAGHDVSIEFDINEQLTEHAVSSFVPDLIIAPFLKRAISENIWQQYLCWIVHPGIVGDRGPSSLDWAIINREQTWGVTIIQANDVMDGGDIWASENFTMREASKSSIYRQEVTQAACVAIFRAIDNLSNNNFKPQKLATYHAPKLGQWRCLISQQDREIFWHYDNGKQIVTKINSADGNPGMLTDLFSQQFYLYNASFDPQRHGELGTIIAICESRICIACIDGGVWISHLKAKPTALVPQTIKLPAMTSLEPLFGEQLKTYSPCYVDENFAEPNPGQEIYYKIEQQVAYLYFNFYNGAMSSEQCRRLIKAYKQLLNEDAKVIVLMGGDDFWSNGIHLNTIENAPSPADESWININAINDLSEVIINTSDKLTISAIRGNAGAGGVFLALACDTVIARDGVILNPHYKSMGNLYGSEYWTYLLPARVGADKAEEIMRNRLPITGKQALTLGIIDQLFSQQKFKQELTQFIGRQLVPITYLHRLQAKQRKRRQDELIKPLAQYRQEELEKMKLNFYGFDPSYHVARYHFVYKLKKARTPVYLAKHRRLVNKHSQLTAN